MEIGQILQFMGVAGLVERRDFEKIGKTYENYVEAARMEPLITVVARDHVVGLGLLTEAKYFRFTHHGVPCDLRGFALDKLVRASVSEAK